MFRSTIACSPVVERRSEGDMMYVECPWCDQSIEMEPSQSQIRCDECRVVMDAAPDGVCEALERAA
jgi:ribosomal protein S27E